MTFNAVTSLRESRRSHPDKPLLHFADHTLTYADVDTMSGRVAGALRGLGLPLGAKVAVQLPNVPEFLFTYYGILKAGLVMVPLNPLLSEAETAFQLTDSGAGLLVTFEGCATRAMAGAARAGVDAVYVVSFPDAGVGEPWRAAGGRDYVELCAAEDSGEIAATSPEDTAVLLYTSGTTGRPKGAELTHFQLHMNCTVAGEVFGFRADDVSLAVLPLFHVFGLSSVLNIAVRFGGTVVLVPRFETTAVLDAVERHRCTVFSGVPTMYVDLSRADVAGRDLSSLRVGISAGAAIPGEVIQAFEKRIPTAVVLEGYGLSETAGTATFNVSAEQRKVLSIGKPLWGVETRIVDPAGVVLPPGPDHIGEITIRGHNVMKGYYKRPAETAETLRDGWLYTGDLGYRDDDGYLHLVDRKKDLVIRGGYNVYPREVEEVLYGHPAVAEAAVLGRSDDRLGEEVVAFVSLVAGAAAAPDEIVAYCRDRLAAYKYPREVRVLDALPKGPTGKILKNELHMR
ncbi:long-chain fatty acid--CoA ligase [Streptomyces sp. SKN60]|uniref:long-chain-fatty-acid--CoA ligase n=1 Tax=Streptomyces sp. SKN60 TaxID=2855506 RepID=UPI002245EEE4|nr:long-chain fatty acid--CoA ligase [Streptomyces sp. SKN60]MCX2181947.1 long-chain fatty acid--CoA ligase [Streptomyces sp. SKN60]